MTDRHLFRGKRSDNLSKDFAVGHYVSVPRHMIVLEELQLNGSWNCFDIDPATLGRCTGLKDRNKKLIFEGDLLSYDCGDGDSVLREVIWLNGRFGVFVRDEFDDRIYQTIKMATIVGNIHDNPELLAQED